MSYLRKHSKEIVASIDNNMDYFKHNHNIFQCMNGNQLSVLKEEFERTVSPMIRQDKMDMAISLNFIQKIVSKLSTPYTFEVERKATSNQDLVDFYVKSLDLNAVMQTSNELFNGMKSVLIEVYRTEKDKRLAIRSIPNDRFFVWTDSVVEPTVPKVFVKMVGQCQDLKYKRTKRDLFFMYTDEEFLAVDSGGSIREEYNVPGDVNEFGKAPFCYINKDVFDIISTPNRDLLQNIIQINSIMTDANVANYYQSFPIRVLINADLENSNININPNSVVVINDKTGDGSSGKAEFKEIASTLDTSKSINLAKEVLQNLLYTFDIAVDGAVTESASGLALTIKGVDTLENRKRQISTFKPAEQDLWLTIAAIHNNLLKKNALGPKVPKMTFSEDFEVDVDFELPSAEVEQAKEAKGETKDTQETADQSKVNASKDGKITDNKDE